MANANPASRGNKTKPPVEKPTTEQKTEAKEIGLQDGFVKVKDGPNGAMITRFTGTLPQGN